MWDMSGDGYARGEGVAAVVLKTVSQAIADNDTIECIIRETSVNQDGRTPGLTMPSNVAQAALIRDCYARAGLDPIHNLADRPQFFQAHGTGTQAGDPQEAEAIATSLFPTRTCGAADKLFVGSIKTVIGHTEGTAGIASIIAMSQALQSGMVPPNLHFNKLNPKVAPFCDHLTVATIPTPWPTTDGQVKRASVNSFGFGGTNAHCIVEEYIPSKEASRIPGSPLLFTPLVFSAASPVALRTTVSLYLDYMKSSNGITLQDLAYTLQSRRSTLAYRWAIAAVSVQDAIQALEAITKSPDGLATRFNAPGSPAKVLGIFTGQGAQWPRMGADLIESSPYVASRIGDLDAALQSLPSPSERPTWTLRDQLLATAATSRVAEAAVAQPLCTAVQIVLVDILRAANVGFDAVVGHSSGEIGAAYAAGFISARDAIRIAYLRGLYAKLALSTSPRSPRGAMLAISASSEDARALCRDPRFLGRIQVAAVNSSSSTTLSGDEDAVDEAEQMLKDRGMFARRLKVDTAYHSTHMNSCAGPYLASLESCGISSTAMDPKDKTCTWISSVFNGQSMDASKLKAQYWIDNMCNPVLFEGALSRAMKETGTVDFVIEVGPHPALKGPATATTGDVPYTGLLARGQRDTEQLSSALGNIWTRLASGSVQFSAVESLLSGVKHGMTMLKDLPPYPFDHNQTYWTDSRMANHFKHRRAVHVPNPVLGSACSEATTPGEFQWRNVLKPSEISWLRGHMLQGQIVFPATGYVSMAVEAVRALVLDSNSNAAIRIIKLTDIEIPRALTFDDDDSCVETIFSVSSVIIGDSSVSADWACYSVPEGSGSAILSAKGHVSGDLFPAVPDALPTASESAYNLVDIGEETFYKNLTSVGYGYSPPFQGLSKICRRPRYSIGTLVDQSGSAWDDKLVLHPGMLDTALQSIFAAWSFPGDTHLWSLRVPVSIAAITINPYFTPLGSGGKQQSMRYQSFIRALEPLQVVGDVHLQTENGCCTVLQFEGATLVPFSRATAKDDVAIFSHFKHKVASPDASLAVVEDALPRALVQLYKDVERVAYWFVRSVSLAIPIGERHDLLLHFQHYCRWCDHIVDMVTRRVHPKVPTEANADTRQHVNDILAQYPERKDVQFVRVVGENLVPVIRSGTTMLQHMNQDELLFAFYEEGSICSGPSQSWLARIVAQVSNRFPGLNVFEVGAGTGATTKPVLRELGDSYGSYTFTDISSGFFIAAEKLFAQDASRMVFQTFNMEHGPREQGFTECSYDVVVAVNVLHVSADLESSLSNIRRLLKPGGFLVVGEFTSTNWLFSGMTVGTLPGWWIGAEAGRSWGPLLTLSGWDTVLRKSGFGGIDTVTPDFNGTLPMNVFVSQAVNDQISLLREPLVSKERPPGVRADGLAIIGGSTWSVHKLGREVVDILSHRYHDSHVFVTMEDFVSSSLTREHAESTTVLVLTDLDRPYLKDITANGFEALKRLWAAAGTLVWVTRGSRDGTAPYGRMMGGILRTIKTEYPNLNPQMFDLEVSPTGSQRETATILAENLLRQHALGSWRPSTGSLLWTLEPEVFLSNGRQLISRLLPDMDKNERYNALRRSVLTTARPVTDSLQLLGVGNGPDRRLELYKVSPLTLANVPGDNPRTVKVLWSSLQSVAVGSVGFLRICAGFDMKSGETVLALTSSTESPATVPAAWSIPLAKLPTASNMVSVAASILAHSIISRTPEATTLLVHEPDIALQRAIQVKAEAKNVHVVFTTIEPQREQGSQASVFVHPNISLHAIRSVVPTSTAVFVHFSRGTRSDAARDSIIRVLPPACLRLGEETVVSHQVKTFGAFSPATDLAFLLQTAWEDASGASTRTKARAITLDDASRHTAVGEPLAVVDWMATDTVTAKVQPINTGTLFQSDKTYLFVGMAGELGQSIATWMISHGARCVVLTSRTPQVNPSFVHDMHSRYGAVVKALSLDITSRDSLWSVHKHITGSLPPIAGVINGAMILQDELFANMSHSSFSHVAAPKVLGTQLLDELFHDAPLDFFIVTSSLSTVIGWSGQSNYSAANEFMTALISHRRGRGVAGSAVNIPGVRGVGYAAKEGHFDFDYLHSIGYTSISEEDLHVLFAEAIVSGRPGQDVATEPQVAMGVGYVPADLEVKDVHRRDAKFGYYVLRKEVTSSATRATSGDSAARVPLKVQLQAAKGLDETYAVIREAFVAYFRRMLRIPEGHFVQDTGTLVEHGVDSLVAVDIRSWFLKELRVDIPTLKILGDGSIADLVSLVVQKLPNSAGEKEARHQDAAGPRVNTARVLDSEQTRGATEHSSPLSAGSPIFTPREDMPLLSEYTTSPSESVYGEKKDG
ncbi:putative PKS/NRPS-like protein biosynthetic cluster [Purpureocillium takamizusanense]|uniref:PKS/NRPS-like protein biosynthetic cluster n=1 Tax=Purpureocillium takamizusanense TaxID=2060973 RepID=A0A9Q8VAZ9_9HYPO|nr:putative PKS/NRPS-like protein biosynthetic cluster [Purpureocillium takamizusanense]UNI18379.1 putative PKS/NRPS-like protein biosynthetic cluster [Purpureocillium takamizusanense]